ncbi:MAG: aminotransferase class V-fold PLP-dependent enzyme, partial [Acidobacteriota bacterium]
METMRERFGIPEGVHYLNHAYMSPLSRPVARAAEAAMARAAWSWDIGPEDFFRDVRRIRERFARLIGAADPERVALVPATSYALAQVARNTPLAPGQNVVLLDEEFPSNRYTWRRRADEADAEVRIVARPDSAADPGTAWSEKLADRIDAGTAAVSLSTVHWCDGTRIELEAVAARAREVGAALIVDGTQSIGAMAFALERARPDAVICAGYKWLTGPYSLGVAWLGERFDGGRPVEETWMAREHSEDFAGLVRDEPRYRPGAARYDVGEAANFLLAPMLAAALEQVLQWGPGQVEGHGRRLCGPLLEELAARGFHPGVPGGGHLFGLRLPEEADPEETRRRLQGRGVHVS